MKTNCSLVKTPGIGWAKAFTSGSRIRSGPSNTLMRVRKELSLTRFPSKNLIVLGAIVDLGNCLNLVESGSLEILSQAYKGLNQVINGSGGKMPFNKKDNRALDCAVIQFIHHSNELERKAAYDTVRCAFPEGQEAYEGAFITSKLHLQICVRNTQFIKGFFLPRPLDKYNPYL